ncbi:MAG: VWA domain-containing protein [bacterium]|nr:VWA domain-containing protein [bacterium]
MSRHLLGLVLVLFVVAPVARAAPSEERPIPLDAVRAGELLRRDEAGWIPLPIVEIGVELEITGLMVHGSVTHRFVNPTHETIEALYVFPLPENAAVYSMEMRIGDRRIVSRIEEKEAARKTYAAARETGRKAALVEQHRPNLFTTAAANINAGEIVVVELQYVHEAQYDAGTFSVGFPLTYTPRFHPPGSENPVAALECSHSAERSVPRATIRVRLEPGFELEELSSASHGVTTVRDGSAFAISPESTEVLAERDFALHWTPRRGSEPTAAAFVESGADGDYALLMLLPPIPASEAGLGLPTETLFVVDVSGSMNGPSIAQARSALLAALDRLRPEDRFNVLKFNGGHAAFRETFLQADEESLDAARDWVKQLEAGGGTMIYPALMRGLSLIAESSSANVKRIVFLTDGAVGNEQQVLGGIVERLGDTRLHAIGIGHAPNGYLMRKMARVGRGLCTFVSNVDTATNEIDAFFARLDRPVMESPQLRIHGVELTEIYPPRLPDLHAGEPLLVSARLGRGDAGSVSIEGYTRAGWVDTEVALDLDAPRASGVGLRWARARVESLMDRMHEGADPADVRRAVIDVALDHHLVTRFTSLVAVDDTPTAMTASTPARIAGALPRGGTDGPLRRLAGVCLLLAGLLALALGRARGAA